MSRMFSKRSLEGYLMVDHRESPGLTPEEAHRSAKAMGVEALPVGRGQFFEAPVANCSHCERHVLMNPLRTRDRGYCPKCDRYLCDQCEAERVRTGVCKPFKQVIDEFINAAAKGKIL